MVCRGARARGGWSAEALNASAGLHFFLPDFVVSMTVVFGCRLAVHFLTYRPVTAERCLLPMMITSTYGGVAAACGAVQVLLHDRHAALPCSLRLRAGRRTPGPCRHRT